MSSDANPAALTDGLGTRWATAETSFKFFASCRHTHPAADALKALMLREGLQADQIAAVTAHVHQGAIDVLGPVVNPATIHQAKFSMGTVLGLVAVHAHAGLGEFEQHSLKDAQVSAFRDKVTMELDEEINAAYPRQWIGRVTVRTTDGRTLQARVDVPKGDPTTRCRVPNSRRRPSSLARSATARPKPRCARSSRASGSSTAKPTSTTGCPPPADYHESLRDRHDHPYPRTTARVDRPFESRTETLAAEPVQGWRPPSTSMVTRSSASRCHRCGTGSISCRAPQREIGVDGHPALGGFLPPVPAAPHVGR
jgi:hypothetical protein